MPTKIEKRNVKKPDAVESFIKIYLIFSKIKVEKAFPVYANECAEAFWACSDALIGRKGNHPHLIEMVPFF